MTIDEAIERCETLATKGHIIFSRDPDIAEECNEKYKQLAEWLEELKAIKDGGIPIIHGQEELKLHDREIRNKAVDDFANRLYLKIKSEIDACADELEWIGEIAKRLKAGDVD